MQNVSSGLHHCTISAAVESGGIMTLRQAHSTQTASESIVLCALNYANLVAKDKRAASAPNTPNAEPAATVSVKRFLSPGPALLDERLGQALPLSEAGASKRWCEQNGKSKAHHLMSRTPDTPRGVRRPPLQNHLVLEWPMPHAEGHPFTLPN